MDDEEQFELRILVNSNERRFHDAAILSLNSQTKRILFVERKTSLGGSFEGLLFLKNDWNYNKQEQEKDLDEFESCVEDVGGLENKLVLLWGDLQYEKSPLEKRLKMFSGCTWTWIFNYEFPKGGQGFFFFLSFSFLLWSKDSMVF